MGLLAPERTGGWIFCGGKLRERLRRLMGALRLLHFVRNDRGGRLFAITGGSEIFRPPEATSQSGERGDCFTSFAMTRGIVRTLK